MARLSFLGSLLLLMQFLDAEPLGLDSRRQPGVNWSGLIRTRMGSLNSQTPKPTSRSPTSLPQYYGTVLTSSLRWDSIERHEATESDRFRAKHHSTLSNTPILQRSTTPPPYGNIAMTSPMRRDSRALGDRFIPKSPKHHKGLRNIRAPTPTTVWPIFSMRPFMDETNGPQKLYAVQGYDLKMPVVIPQKLQEELQVVLCFKDEVEVPMYSLDLRHDHIPYIMVDAVKGGDSQSIGFNYVNNKFEQYFKLSAMSPADEGYYRCRADFRDTPSMNFEYDVKLVVAPDTVIILLENNTELTDFTPPIPSGINLALKCYVTGGIPDPDIVWYWDETKITSDQVDYTYTAESLLDGSVSYIIFSNVTVGMDNTFVECHATSSVLIPPSVNRVKLLVYDPVSTKTPISVDGSWLINGKFKMARMDMYMNCYDDQWEMYKVSISNDTKKAVKGALIRLNGFEAGQVIKFTLPDLPRISPTVELQFSSTFTLTRATLGCRSSNFTNFTCDQITKPPTTFIQLDNMKTEAQTGVKRIQKYTVDYITLITRANNDKSFVFSHLPFVLDNYVMDLPRCAELYKSYNVGELVNDVTFAECEIILPNKYKDDAIQFEWVQNVGAVKIAIPAVNVTSSGNHSSLVFKPYYNVAKKSYDTLECLAHTERGNQLCPCIIHEDSICVPRCINSTIRAVPGHHTTASCKLDLPKEVSLKFKWSYIVGGRKTEVAAESVNSSDTESIVSFKPEYDNATDTLGSLECIAKGFGQHMQLLCPCVVEILEADFPSPPKNCTVMKEKGPKNWNFVVSCIESYDGGIEQKFVLVVLNPIDNITTKHVNHSYKENWTIDNEFLNKAMGDEKSDNIIYYMDTKTTPVFHVKNLGEQPFAIKVYAVNDKGQSAAVKLSTNFGDNNAVYQRATLTFNDVGGYALLTLLLGLLVLSPLIYVIVRLVEINKKQPQCQAETCDGINNVQPNTTDAGGLDIAAEDCQTNASRKCVTFSDEISIHEIPSPDSSTEFHSSDDDEEISWEWD